MATKKDRAPHTEAIMTKHCQECGVVFLRNPKLSSTQWGKTRLCSTSCRDVEQTRVRRDKQPDLHVVLSKYQEDENGCWNWVGHISGEGYGIFRWKGSTFRAHAKSLAYHKGQKDGFIACHHCDNRKCINPDHLYWGTTASNSLDKVSRGRQAKGQGVYISKLTDEAVRHIRRSRMSNVYLATYYGVSRGTLARARNGKTWKHIQ